MGTWTKVGATVAIHYISHTATPLPDSRRPAIAFDRSGNFMQEHQKFGTGTCQSPGMVGE